MRSKRNDIMVAMIVTFLFFCLIGFPLHANGEEFFMGKVLSVDTAKNEIEVVPEALSDDKSGESANEESVFVQSKVVLPPCVIIGAKIRLWGNRPPDHIKTFIATEIRGCRGGGCSDPTGVRSRLSRRKEPAWRTTGHSISRKQNTDYKKRQGAGSRHGSRHGGRHGGRN